MSLLIEIIKSIILGIVEGITEWLPISSTGHMILVDEFLQLNVSEDFKNVFFVVIQLGAILAVILLYWSKIWPFKKDRYGKMSCDHETMILWAKILIACVPAGVIGLLFDDVFEALFYNSTTVAIMLILVGVVFIVVENYNKTQKPQVTTLEGITYKAAFIIGLFQLIAAVFPGTSRSGATIVGALLIGISRTVAAEFTFFLAIPVMFGASALKLVKFAMSGLSMTGAEWVILLVGTFVAFIVSIIAIKFLMSYIKKNDFKAFGWYRIVLGVLVLLYFFVYLPYSAASL